MMGGVDATHYSEPEMIKRALLWSMLALPAIIFAIMLLTPGSRLDEKLWSLTHWHGLPSDRVVAGLVAVFAVVAVAGWLIARRRNP